MTTKSVRNTASWRCPRCNLSPLYFTEAACSKGCGTTIQACGNCARHDEIATQLEVHEKACTATGSAVAQGGRTLSHHAAQLGLRIGHRRGRATAVTFGLLGAAAGHLIQRVAEHPDLAGYVKLARDVHGPAKEVLAYLRGQKGQGK